MTSSDAQAGRSPSPCWGAFDGVALHEAHAYDGKWCPGLSGRTPSPTEEAAMSGDDHEDEAWNPRWRDVHELPDAWLLRKTRPFRARTPKWAARLMARYAFRFVYCPRDGVCVLRAGHRGCCDWGE